MMNKPLAIADKPFRAMKANTNNERNFYTQGQRFAARVLLIVWLLASGSPDSILATPKRQMMPATTASPQGPSLASTSPTPPPGGAFQLPPDSLGSFWGDSGGSSPSIDAALQERMRQEAVPFIERDLLRTSPKVSPVGENLSFQARGGEKVRFHYQRGQWHAEVSSHIGAFARRAVLSVVCSSGEDVTSCLEVLSNYPSWQRQRQIHVLDRNLCPTLEEVVYVGALGLKGGSGGEASGSGEQEESPLGDTVLDASVWERYFGEVEAPSGLPADIAEILGSPCPFWEGKQVRDTHLLALIPSHVGGQPLTLDYLGELIKSPKEGGAGTKYREYWSEVRKAIGSQSPGNSYWVLMTRDVLKGSRSKNRKKQWALLSDDAKGTYELSSALESSIVMLLHHVRSGERLYSVDPLTYTICREKIQNRQLAVGGFSSVGLDFLNFSDGYCQGFVGLAVLRKFGAAIPSSLGDALIDKAEGVALPSFGLPSSAMPRGVASSVTPGSVLPPSGVSSLMTQERAQLAEEKPAAELTYKKLQDDLQLLLQSAQGTRLPTSEVPSSVVASPVIDAAVWERYFGDVGVTPPLPDGLEALMDSPCPFWEGKRVKDTHLLALIPSHVGGQPLTLDYLGELIQSPKGGGHGTKYRYYWNEIREAIGSQSPGRSYWVLMTRDVLPESRNKVYEDQRKLVAAHATRTGISYEVPRALEAAVVMLLHHVRSGERLYSDSPWTYTRCRDRVQGDQLVVGGFSSGGLIVAYYSYDYNYFRGVSALRKF